MFEPNVNHFRIALDLLKVIGVCVQIVTHQVLFYPNQIVLHTLFVFVWTRLHLHYTKIYNITMKYVCKI